MMKLLKGVKNMNRKIVISMGLLALLVIGSSFTLTTTSAATNVKIGLLTPKTGALGFLGQSFEDGANLAIDDLNAMSSDFTFELVVGDTQTDAAATATATTTLISGGVSGIVGAAASSDTISAIAIAKDSNVPMISYASTSPSITDEEDGDFLFRVVPSDSFQGKALADLIGNEGGFSKVAIIGLNDAYGTGLAAAFKDAFSGSISSEQTYPSDQKDFSTEVAAVKASDAEAILLISFNDDGTAILKELATQGVTLPVYGTDGTKSSALFASENFDGMKGTAPQVKNTTSFFNAFVNKFAYAPTIFVPETYDATMILGKAAIEANSADSCSVADNIRVIGKNYNGVSSTITFDVNGDQVSASYEYWQADSASSTNFTKIGEFVPDTASANLGTNPAHCSTTSPSPISTISVLFGMISVATLVMLKRRK